MSESTSPITQRVQSLSGPDSRGKHRILAELKRLEQETRFLEEDIELLEKMEKASAACKEMLSYVETRPDPLLSETSGPINPIWDRWFEGPRDSKGCRCWFRPQDSKGCRCWFCPQDSKGCRCWFCPQDSKGCRCWFL